MRVEGQASLDGAATWRHREITGLLIAEPTTMCATVEATVHPSDSRDVSGCW